MGGAVPLMRPLYLHAVYKDKFTFTLYLTEKMFCNSTWPLDGQYHCSTFCPPINAMQHVSPYTIWHSCAPLHSVPGSQLMKMLSNNDVCVHSSTESSSYWDEHSEHYQKVIIISK